MALHTLFPEPSPLSEKNCEYRVELPTALKEFEKNQLLSYTLDAHWRLGDVVRSQFHFVPDAPVPSKELSIIGGLEAELDFSGNRTGILSQGRFDANKHIDGILAIKNPDGTEKHFDVQWDSQGKTLKKEPHQEVK